MNKRILVILLLMLILSIAVSLTLGKYGLSSEKYFRYVISLFGGENSADFDVTHVLITQIRLPRIIACVLIGAALSVSGAAYQAMFINPLVSPSILGVLSGAAFGAGLWIYFEFSAILMQICVFIFGFLAVIFALFIAFLYSRGNGLVILILGGIISGSLFSALLSVLKYAADPNDALPSITYFLMGNLGFASKNSILAVVLPMSIGILLLLCSGKFLNALSLGEDEAKSMGVNTAKVKIFVVLIATLISALSVMLAGIIGWVGLIVPHIARFLFGADNRSVLSASAIIGAIFLLFCDGFSRLIFTYEIPIGIVTSLFGIPFFIVVLRHVKKGSQ